MDRTNQKLTNSSNVSETIRRKKTTTTTTNDETRYNIKTSTHSAETVNRVIKSSPTSALTKHLAQPVCPCRLRAKVNHAERVRTEET